MNKGKSSRQLKFVCYISIDCVLVSTQYCYPCRSCYGPCLFMFSAVWEYQMYAGEHVNNVRVKFVHFCLKRWLKITSAKKNYRVNWITYAMAFILQLKFENADICICKIYQFSNPYVHKHKYLHTDLIFLPFFEMYISFSKSMALLFKNIHWFLSEFVFFGSALCKCVFTFCLSFVFIFLVFAHRQQSS